MSQKIAIHLPPSYALQPRIKNDLLPPLRMRLKDFLELSTSFSAALEKLEIKYHRQPPMSGRAADDSALNRRPR